MPHCGPCNDDDGGVWRSRSRGGGTGHGWCGNVFSSATMCTSSPGLGSRQTNRNATVEKDISSKPATAHRCVGNCNEALQQQPSSSTSSSSPSLVHSIVMPYLPLFSFPLSMSFWCLMAPFFDVGRCCFCCRLPCCLGCVGTGLKFIRKI